MAEQPGHLTQAYDIAISTTQKNLLWFHLIASVVEALVLIARSIKDLKR